VVTAYASEAAGCEFKSCRKLTGRHLFWSAVKIVVRFVDCETCSLIQVLSLTQHCRPSILREIKWILCRFVSLFQCWVSRPGPCHEWNYSYIARRWNAAISWSALFCTSLSSAWLVFSSWRSCYLINSFFLAILKLHVEIVGKQLQISSWRQITLK